MKIGGYVASMQQNHSNYEVRFTGEAWVEKRRPVYYCQGYLV